MTTNAEPIIKCPHSATITPIADITENKPADPDQLPWTARTGEAADRIAQLADQLTEQDQQHANAALRALGDFARAHEKLSQPGRDIVLAIMKETHAAGVQPCATTFTPHSLALADCCAAMGTCWAPPSETARPQKVPRSA